MTRIIWLTDLHYMGSGDINGHDPRVRVAAALTQVSTQFADADAVVITGDLAEDGLASDYAALAPMLAALPMPVLSLVGNHDNRDEMARHLAPPEGAMHGFRQFAHVVGDDVVLALDTANGVDAPGHLCAARLDWLRAALHTHADKRVIVAMHHPPVPLGLPNQDHEHVGEGAALMALLAAHGGVAHVLCGHVHRSVQTVVGGVPVSAGRAVAYQTPALRPLWTWDGFTPAPEPPTLGVLDLTPAGVILHQHQICAFEHGVRLG